MIRVVNLGDNKEKEIDSGSLQDLDLKDIWLEITDPTENELQSIADKAGVWKHFLELPETGGAVDLRLEDDFGILNFLIVQDVTSAYKCQPIVMVFSKAFLITISRGIIQPLIDMAKERMSRTKLDPPTQVAYFIIDEIVSGHFDEMERLEEFASSIEEEVVEKTSADTLKKIFNLKSRLVTFNKTLWYERGVIFNLKTCGDVYIPAKVRSMFDTTHEDITRQIDIVETYREIMSDAINVHLSAVSNKINLSIQSLTVIIFYLSIITTVTAFPNTIATFFGISRFGNTDVWIILAAIAVSTILPFVWLWRKKWLKYNDGL
jgi:magnesium transporter